MFFIIEIDCVEVAGVIYPAIWVWIGAPKMIDTKNRGGFCNVIGRRGSLNQNITTVLSFVQLFKLTPRFVQKQRS